MALQPPLDTQFTILRVKINGILAKEAPPAKVHPLVDRQIERNLDARQAAGIIHQLKVTEHIALRSLGVKIRSTKSDREDEAGLLKWF